MSELYELPTGWEWKKLKDIFKMKSGDFLPKKNMIENGGYYVYGGNGINGEYNQFNLSGDNIIIGRVGALCGNVRYIDSKIWITDNAFYISEYMTNINRKYLSIFLSYTNLGKTANQAAQPVISNKGILKLLIPIPSLLEQKRIVSKLDNLFEKIDKSIALHQRNIDEADVFMGSVLNDVFGELEEKYNLKTIETFSKVGTGVTPLKSKTQYYENGNINWITSKATNFDFVYDCEQLVTDTAISECRLKIFPVGTIIVALYGQGKTRGQVSELMIETATNQAIATIVVDDNLAVNRYLKYFLKKSYLDLRRKASGGTQPNLNLTIIKNIELPLPFLNIQQKTVTYLDKISKKTEKLKQVQKEKMQSLVALKASILDQAFKGKL